MQPFDPSPIFDPSSFAFLVIALAAVLVAIFVAGFLIRRAMHAGHLHTETIARSPDRKSPDPTGTGVSSSSYPTDDSHRAGQETSGKGPLPMGKKEEREKTDTYKKKGES
ncbi:MAG: hypothetical protein BAJATHORv1_60018 [Candidatus Thorarchaeota archaeon]|nr:MAG: hypothetical protein BAJATHORv1_60018 [Candidatus Thorarchaeota archaeon]